MFSGLFFILFFLPTNAFRLHLAPRVYTGSSFTRRNAVAPTISSRDVSIQQTFKDLHSKGKHKDAIQYLLAQIDSGAYKLEKKDIDFATSSAWELKSSDSALQVLTVASTTGVEVGRHAMYNAMKCFCYQSRYKDISYTLDHLFPPERQLDSMTIADRFKWKCRVYCEEGAPQLALDMLKKASQQDPDASLYDTALRTIMQTCSTTRSFHHVLAAYAHYQLLHSSTNTTTTSTTSPEGTLLGNDYLSVFRAAKSFDKHEIVCSVLSQWATLDPNTTLLPTHFQYLQAIPSAVALHNYPKALEFLSQLQTLKYDNLTYTAASLLYATLTQSGPEAYKTTKTAMEALGIQLQSHHFTSLMAAKPGNVTAMVSLIGVMLEDGILPENKALSIILQTCYKTNRAGLAIRLTNQLRRMNYTFDEYHYSILVKIYGEERKPEEALAILRETLKSGIPIDVRFYATVMDALANQIGSNRERITPEAEAQEGLLAMTCYRLLDEALHRQNVTKEAIARSPALQDSVLTLFNTGMKPASRLGDYERVQTLIHRMTELNVDYDNITMSAVLQAYTSAGKLSNAISAFHEYFASGRRPNGLVACVLINALSRLGRYSESWIQFADYCNRLGMPVTKTFANGTMLPLKLTDSAEYHVEDDATVVISSGGFFKSESEMRFDDAVSSALYSCSRAGLYKEALAAYSVMQGGGQNAVMDSHRTLVLKAIKVAGKTGVYEKYAQMFKKTHKTSERSSGRR